MGKLKIHALASVATCSYLRQQVERLVMGKLKIHALASVATCSYLRQQVERLVMGKLKIHALASVATVDKNLGGNVHCGASRQGWISFDRPGACKPRCSHGSTT